jgi:hypothetical protein
VSWTVFHAFDGAPEPGGAGALRSGSSSPMASKSESIRHLPPSARCPSDTLASSGIGSSLARFEGLLPVCIISVALRSSLALGRTASSGAKRALLVLGGWDVVRASGAKMDWRLMARRFSRHFLSKALESPNWTREASKESSSVSGSSLMSSESPSATRRSSRPFSSFLTFLQGQLNQLGQMQHIFLYGGYSSSVILGLYRTSGTPLR